MYEDGQKSRQGTKEIFDIVVEYLLDALTTFTHLPRTPTYK